MPFPSALFLLLAVTFNVFTASLLFADDAAPARDPQLERAFDNLLKAIDESSQQLRRDPYYEGSRDQAAGTAYWAQMLIRTLEEDLIQDPDFPLFRVVDFRIREGADNPDQRYLVAPVRGGERYRIRGRRDGERRIEFQLYAGVPWAAGGGKVLAALSTDELRIDADGNFEILLDPNRQAGNWLANPAGGTMVMVRQIFSDWAHERAGEIHIDRVGYEGALKPPLTDADMAARLDRAADNLRALVPLWPEFARTRFAQKEPNTLSPPFDPGAAGGVVGRWMSLGEFDLQPDEALVLTTWPSRANYQGIQLTDRWTSSLEYANRQTSLSTDQAFKSSDGAYHFVIAHRDPGVQNWLDTTGLRHGFLLLRYDGMRGEKIPQAQWPTLQKIRLQDLRKHLPADTPAFTVEQRRQSIEQRRRHVQQRFGV